MPLGTQTRIASPNINLSGFSAANPAVLTFDRSYALRPATTNDYLSVQFSTDCGLTWLNQRNYFPGDLNTRDTLRVYGFTPKVAADWKQLRLDIPTSYYTSRFQVRLQLISNGGNNLYVDKLAIGAATALVSRSRNSAGAPLLVFPNPLTAETAIEFTLPAADIVEVRLTDVLGRLVRPSTRLQGQAGRQTLPLLAGAPRPAPGIYLIELRSATARWTTKLVIE